MVIAEPAITHIQNMLPKSNICLFTLSFSEHTFDGISSNINIIEKCSELLWKNENLFANSLSVLTCDALNRICVNAKVALNHLLIETENKRKEKGRLFWFRVSFLGRVS
jgi:hypothetical protein